MSAIADRLRELKTLPVSAAILDPSGTIVAVNDTWKLFAQHNGLRLANYGIGSNYLKYCTSNDSCPALRPTELDELLAGQRDLVTLIYPCHSPKEKRWFSLIGLPLSLDRQGGVAMLHINLTDTLPLSTDTNQVQAGDPTMETGNAVSMDTISGRIEHSILETLSSQLSTMFSRKHPMVDRRHTSKHLAAEELARTALSKRQMEVLRLLGEGKTNKEIAQALSRSPHTIKLHVSAILEQLHLRTRTEAALIASRIYSESSSNSPKLPVGSCKHAHADSAQHSDHSLREKASPISKRHAA
jgi:DNA-binding CsgD family transcriptional regulator